MLDQGAETLRQSLLLFYYRKRAERSTDLWKHHVYLGSPLLLFFTLILQLLLLAHSLSSSTPLSLKLHFDFPFIFFAKI